MAITPEQLVELEKQSQINEQLASHVESFSLAYRMSEQKQPAYTPHTVYSVVTHPTQPQHYGASLAPSVPLGWGQAQVSWNDGWRFAPSSATSSSRGANVAAGSLSADEQLGRKGRVIASLYGQPQAERWLFETPEQLGTRVYPTGDLVMEVTGEVDFSDPVVLQQMHRNIAPGQQFGLSGADASSLRMAEQGVYGAKFRLMRSSMGDVSESILARAESEVVREQEVREQDEAKGFRRVDRFGRSSGESYAPIIENGFLRPVDAPFSTFSIDVDTASYANV
ncbi:MAG: von Willebrand factor type A domain-containing protein, partial [Planctomycetaceae bacterium]|nr:von Willebrand factor type A domain-containing protein [Planctomycetaceae bacterium]